MGTCTTNDKWPVTAAGEQTGRVQIGLKAKAATDNPLDPPSGSPPLPFLSFLLPASRDAPLLLSRSLALALSFVASGLLCYQLEQRARPDQLACLDPDTAEQAIGCRCLWLVFKRLSPIGPSEPNSGPTGHGARINLKPQLAPSPGPAILPLSKSQGHCVESLICTLPASHRGPSGFCFPCLDRPSIVFIPVVPSDLKRLHSPVGPTLVPRRRAHQSDNRDSC